MQALFAATPRIVAFIGKTPWWPCCWACYLPLLALAIGCGSLFFNNANHVGFWMVKESFGMTMGAATQTISVVQPIVSIVGLPMVLLFSRLPALG